MSDIREVVSYHEAMEGTLTVAGERIQDAIDELVARSGFVKHMTRLIDFLDRWNG